MQLICVRHGRTAWNAEMRFQGRTDIPLDGEGRAQASALAAYLKPERFDLAVASDLVRARATAEAICAGRATALELEPALREMSFGEWEGLTWPEIVARWPAAATYDGIVPRTYTPAGGETWTAVRERVESALRGIAARLNADDRALVVSHAGVMHAILAALGGEGTDESLRVRLVPASIVRLSGSFDAGWTVDAINETAPAVAEPA